jgi:hypothetical protein
MVCRTDEEETVVALEAVEFVEEEGPVPVGDERVEVF